MGKKSLFVAVLTLILSLSAAPAVADIATGLVAYWALDEGSGTIASDVSPYGNHGTLMGGPTWVAGRFGQALDFDGVDDYVIVDSPNNMNFGAGSNFSLTAWVKIRSCQSSGSKFIEKKHTGAEGLNLQAYSSDNYPRFYARCSSAASTSAIGTTVINDDAWHFLVGVKEGNTLHLYVDGSLQATSSAAFAGNWARGVVRIGHSIDGGARLADGLIDEVRIYNRALSAAEIMELVRGQRGLPSRPGPANDKDDIPVDSMLSWAPGEFAVTHDIYLGKNSSDVNDATITSPLGVLLRAGHDANTIDPGRLEFGTRYCWRVDEVNGPPDHTVYQGPVWSFTTEPEAYRITDVIATASSSISDAATPQKTVDGSGLTDGLHDTTAENMWQSAASGLPATIAFQFDQAYSLHAMKVWNHNTTSEDFLGFGAKEVTIEVADSNDGPWTPLADVTLNKAPGLPNAEATDTIDMLGAVASNVRLTITSNHEGLPATGLAEVQFFYIPVAARELQPADGAALEGTEVTLAWRGGRDAAQHEVYLDTEENLALVQGSDPAALAATVAAQGAYGSYTASDLNLSQTYVWKVVEVNAVETPAAHESPIRSFTTAEYLVVEDFEDYTNDSPKRLFQTWIDGWGFSPDEFFAQGRSGNGTGAAVGHDIWSPESPHVGETIVETSIVRPGSKQSMPLHYDNTAVAISEAQYTFAAQNWTANGVKSLSLWFYGDPANTGTLYLKINNTKVPYSGEAADIKRSLWQPWNIDLSAVGGNLTNVTTLAIGVEGAGAAGVIYIDDIRLYGKAPEFIIPVEPGSVGLLAHYDFETGQGATAFDRSANKRDGRIIGAQWFSPGWDGQTGHCLLFDGVGTNRVDLGAFDVAGSGITITSWSKAYNLDTPGNDPRLVSKANGGAGENHWWATGSCREGSNKRVRFRLKTNGVTTELKAGTAGVIGLDEWIHITATWDGATMRSYKNGVQVGSVAKGGTISIDPAVKVAIGNQPEGAEDRPWDGLIDDVRIYERTLSEEEILWLAGTRAPVHKPF